MDSLKAKLEEAGANALKPFENEGGGDNAFKVPGALKRARRLYRSIPFVAARFAPV